MATSFDNRRAPFSLWRQHLQFRIGGERYLYCYIRKNACSAMKRVVLEAQGEDPNAHTGRFPFERYRFLSVAGIGTGRFTRRFFIYRDPLERIVSLYNNKFVQQVGHQHLFPRYEAVLKRPAAEATFEEFVTEYLSLDDSKTDPHCHSQYGHLWPIRYTHAISIETLTQQMAELLGPDIAERHFAHRPNATSTRRYDESATDIPAVWLKQRFDETGEIPSVSALVTGRLRDMILRRYQDDYRMIDALR